MGLGQKSPKKCSCIVGGRKSDSIYLAVLGGLGSSCAHYNVTTFTVDPAGAVNFNYMDCVHDWALRAVGPEPRPPLLRLSGHWRCG